MVLMALKPVAPPLRAARLGSSMCVMFGVIFAQTALFVADFTQPQTSSRMSGSWPITAPQPSLKAREMTLRFVPGGPDPMTKGFGILSPSTVVANVGIRLFLRVFLVTCFQFLTRFGRIGYNNFAQKEK